MKRGIAVVLLWIVLLAGCFGGAGRSPYIRHYVLEYPQAGPAARPAVAETVRVERFFAGRMFLGQAMLFRQGPNIREAYATERWRIAPGDMVTELLRRDLRAAGLFRAVLGERDPEESRYSLTGGVEEFIEVRGDSGRTASLAVTVTLLDLSRRETPGWVVFQKTYRSEAAIVGEGGAGLAGAMSRAMSDLSRQVIADIAAR